MKIKEIYKVHDKWSLLNCFMIGLFTSMSFVITCEGYIHSFSPFHFIGTVIGILIFFTITLGSISLIYIAQKRRLAAEMLNDKEISDATKARISKYSRTLLGEGNRAIYVSIFLFITIFLLSIEVGAELELIGGNGLKREWISKPGDVDLLYEEISLLPTDEKNLPPAVKSAIFYIDSKYYNRIKRKHDLTNISGVNIVPVNFDARTVQDILDKNKTYNPVVIKGIRDHIGKVRFKFFKNPDSLYMVSSIVSTNFRYPDAIEVEVRNLKNAMNAYAYIRTSEYVSALPYFNSLVRGILKSRNTNSRKNISTALYSRGKCNTSLFINNPAEAKYDLMNSIVYSKNSGGITPRTIEPLNQLLDLLTKPFILTNFGKYLDNNARLKSTHIIPMQKHCTIIQQYYDMYLEYCSQCGSDSRFFSEVICEERSKIYYNLVMVADYFLNTWDETLPVDMSLINILHSLLHRSNITTNGPVQDSA